MGKGKTNANGRMDPDVWNAKHAEMVAGEAEVDGKKPCAFQLPDFIKQASHAKLHRTSADMSVVTMET
jgi:hypothetical protein